MEVIVCIALYSNRKYEYFASAMNGNPKIISRYHLQTCQIEKILYIIFSLFFFRILDLLENEN